MPEMGDISERRVIHQGQCCNCYYDDGLIRLWVCRVGGGKTVEEHDEETGRWEITQGGCYSDGEVMDSSRGK